METQSIFNIKPLFHIYCTYIIVFLGVALCVVIINICFMAMRHVY